MFVRKMDHSKGVDGRAPVTLHRQLDDVAVEVQKCLTR